MAPIGLKLCQNAFYTIPNISFFDAPQKIGEIFGSKKKNRTEKKIGSKKQFFAILARFVRSYGQTDFKIGFGVKCCSRYTFPEVCTPENHENVAKTL